MNSKQIHIGNEITSRLNSLNISKSEFARRIGTSKQNVNRILEKSSLDTDTLLKYGDVLNCNFFELFCKKADIDIRTTGNQSPAMASGSISLNIQKEESPEVAALRELADERKERIEELKKRIKELEDER